MEKCIITPHLKGVMWAGTLESGKQLPNESSGACGDLAHNSEENGMQVVS